MVATIVVVARRLRGATNEDDSRQTNRRTDCLAQINLSGGRCLYDFLI